MDFVDPDDPHKRTKTKDEEIEELAARLTISQAFINFLTRAYDALFNFGVNYRDLPEYSDTEPLERAHQVGFAKGRGKLIAWIGRLERGLSAAIRRSKFRDVNKPNGRDDNI